jgi:hypothetical protein
MKCNVGKTDRKIRIIAGILIAILAVISNHTGWAVFGIILAIEGFIRWCALYALLGVFTNKSDK